MKYSSIFGCCSVTDSSSLLYDHCIYNFVLLYVGTRAHDNLWLCDIRFLDTGCGCPRPDSSLLHHHDCGAAPVLVEDTVMVTGDPEAEGGDTGAVETPGSGLGWRVPAAAGADDVGG